MNKRLTWIGILVTVGCAAGSDAGSQIAADAMTSVGDMLSDAGHALSDTGVVLAQDATTVTATCDAYTDWTVTPKDEKKPSTTTRTYYADVLTDTADVVGVDARLCDREVLGSDPLVFACPDNSDCEGEYNHIAPCSVTSAAELDADRIRVPCGGESFTNTEAPHRGFRWNSVEVHVRRRND